MVRIRVAPSKDFKRQGSNLHHDAKIPMHTALLGGKVRIPTLDGQVDVRVPTGTQPGEEMVLKTRGVPRVYGGENGDLFVKFNVVLPRRVFPYVIVLSVDSLSLFVIVGLLPGDKGSYCKRSPMT